MPCRAADRHRAPAAAAARAELDRYPLTETEAAPHADGPLGADRRLVLVRRRLRPLALALHEETGLPLVAILEALDGAGGDDLPLELVVADRRRLRRPHAVRAAAGTPSSSGDERLVGIAEDRVRALCRRRSDGVDPDDPPTAAAAREAARFLVERVGRAPR